MQVRVKKSGEGQKVESGAEGKSRFSGTEFKERNITKDQTVHVMMIHEEEANVGSDILHLWPSLAVVNTAITWLLQMQFSRIISISK